MKTNVRNSDGFSLIELLTALVIIALMLLALSSVLIHAIRVNVANDLRNAAMRLISQTSAAILVLPYESVHSCGITADPRAACYDNSYHYSDDNTCLSARPNDYRKYPDPVQFIKGFRQRFNILWDVRVLSEDLKQVTIHVAYRESGEDHLHSAVMYRHRKP